MTTACHGYALSRIKRRLEFGRCFAVFHCTYCRFPWENAPRSHWEEANCTRYGRRRSQAGGMNSVTVVASIATRCSKSNSHRKSSLQRGPMQPRAVIQRQAICDMRHRFWRIELVSSALPPQSGGVFDGSRQRHTPDVDLLTEAFRRSL
jgi:hypothetical protein